MASAYLELTTGTPEDAQYTAVESLSASFSDGELSNLHVKITNVDLFQPMQLSALTLSDTATVVFDVRMEDVSKVQTACILSGLQIFSEGTNGANRRILKASKSGSIVVKSRALSNNIIDEDDLLQDEGDWAPDTTVKSKNIDDCGGREPCDDCTCGRAGGGETDNQNTPPPKTSNCGKCGMGDAFRCASCPFLGKPAFKPGQEHLVLDLQDDL